MIENNPKSKPTVAQEIAWLKREIPWTYQIEDAKGMMRESSGYLPAHELEKDQALTAEVLNSIPVEDRTHWRAVREEIVRDHLKAGKSKAAEVVNVELAHRVTRHYPHTDIDASIMRKRQSQIENQHIPQGQRISGHLVGAPKLKSTPSGKPYYMVNLADLPLSEPDRTVYEVAIVTDRGRHQVESLQTGDRFTVQGKVGVDDVVNTYTGEIEQKHRMIAQDAYVSWGDHEKNRQDAAMFDPAVSKRPNQTPETVTELAVRQQVQQHPPGSGVGGPSI